MEGREEISKKTESSLLKTEKTRADGEIGAMVFNNVTETDERETTSICKEGAKVRGRDPRIDLLNDGADQTRDWNPREEVHTGKEASPSSERVPLRDQDGIMMTAGHRRRRIDFKHTWQKQK